MLEAMRAEQGFTIIELLVVISIIGILAGQVLVAVEGARAKARDTDRINTGRQLQNALELYYSDHGSYPSGAWFRIHDCPINPDWNSFPDLDETLLNRIEIPALDSGGLDCGWYRSLQSGQGYCFSMQVEDASLLDQDDSCLIPDSSGVPKEQCYNSPGDVSDYCWCLGCPA